MSASPGRLGGLRGLNSLRTLLTGIKVLVLPGQVTVERAKTAFDGDGRLIDAGKAAAVAAMGRAVADHARKLRAPDGAPD